DRFQIPVVCLKKLLAIFFLPSVHHDPSRHGPSRRLFHLDPNRHGPNRHHGPSHHRRPNLLHDDGAWLLHRYFLGRWRFLRRFHQPASHCAWKPADWPIDWQLPHRLTTQLLEWQPSLLFSFVPPSIDLESFG